SFAGMRRQMGRPHSESTCPSHQIRVDQSVASGVQIGKLRNLKAVAVDVDNEHALFADGQNALLNAADCKTPGTPIRLDIPIPVTELFLNAVDARDGRDKVAAL